MAPYLNALEPRCQNLLLHPASEYPPVGRTYKPPRTTGSRSRGTTAEETGSLRAPRRQPRRPRSRIISLSSSGPKVWGVWCMQVMALASRTSWTPLYLVSIIYMAMVSANVPRRKVWACGLRDTPEGERWARLSASLLSMESPSLTSSSQRFRLFSSPGARTWSSSGRGWAL